MEHHHGQVEDKESVATENGYEVWYSDGYGAQYNETILVISMEITWGDVNWDGKANYMDTFLAVQYAVGQIGQFPGDSLMS